ncbi:MAG: hypothetical protein KAJ49_00690 [Arcobacteraceae bacterium]|nr:hypothetical protein [Arcobacteraceae bacterium]
MCLIIASVFLYLGYSFFLEGDILSASINGVIAILFMSLMVRNILKTREERKANGK